MNRDCRRLGDTTKVQVNLGVRVLRGTVVRSEKTSNRRNGAKITYTVLLDEGGRAVDVYGINVIEIKAS